MIRRRRYAPVVLAVAVVGQAVAEGIATPEVTDARLQISLLASEPEVVTPTGVAYA